MPIPVRILLLTVFLIGICWLLYRYLRSFVRYRNKMVVICPETEKQVGVDMDAKHAAITGALGKESLRLTDCTRWPERENCGQECLAQIQASPEGCMVRKRLESWYRGKACTYCNKEFRDIVWHEHKPALVSPDYTLLQWEEIPVEELSEILATHKPVCGTCNFAEKW